MFTPERHLPTPGQRRHSPQRHTAAGTAASTTTDTGNTVPQRQPHSNGLYSYIYVYMRICIYIEKERERGRAVARGRTEALGGRGEAYTVVCVLFWLCVSVCDLSLFFTIYRYIGTRMYMYMYVYVYIEIGCAIA